MSSTLSNAVSFSLEKLLAGWKPVTRDGHTVIVYDITDAEDFPVRAIVNPFCPAKEEIELTIDGFFTQSKEPHELDVLLLEPAEAPKRINGSAECKPFNLYAAKAGKPFRIKDRPDSKVGRILTWDLKVKFSLADSVTDALVCTEINLDGAEWIHIFNLVDPSIDPNSAYSKLEMLPEEPLYVALYHRKGRSSEWYQCGRQLFSSEIVEARPGGPVKLNEKSRSIATNFIGYFPVNKDRIPTDSANTDFSITETDDIDDL